MNNLEPYDQAYLRSTRIINLRNQLESGFQFLAQELYEFNKKRQYELLGYPSLRSYCSDPEVDINIRTAYRLIGVYEQFVLKLKIPQAELAQIGYTKLEMIRPYITSSNYNSWIEKASSLSKKDLIKEIQEEDADYNPPQIHMFDALTVAYQPIDKIQNSQITQVELRDAKVTRASKKFFLEGFLNETNSQ